jgi:hypothetical protein
MTNLLECLPFYLEEEYGSTSAPRGAGGSGTEELKKEISGS